jgi:hypothetical protein
VQEKGYISNEPIVRMYQASERTEFVLKLPMLSARDTTFYYNGGNPHVPSALITKKTGAIAFDFAKKQLLEPLGITTAKWGQAVSTRKPPPLAERGCRWRLTRWHQIRCLHVHKENVTWKVDYPFDVEWTGQERQMFRQHWVTIVPIICDGRFLKTTPAWRADATPI